jgi:hypothetical protein
VHLFAPYTYDRSDFEDGAGFCLLNIMRSAGVRCEPLRQISKHLREVPEWAASFLMPYKCETIVCMVFCCSSYYLVTLAVCGCIV